MNVRCATCHREERWSDGSVEVVLPGGSRRPAVHPTLAAWQALRRSRRGELGPVVGACDACAQPMVSDDPDAASIRWTLSTPIGPVEVGRQSITGPDGALSDGDADRLLHELFREPLDLAGGLARGGMMTMMFVPLAATFVFSTWIGVLFFYSTIP